MQYLQQFIYSNNELGLKSLENIKLLIPNIFDLALNNIKLDAGYLDNKLYGKTDIIEDILSVLASPNSSGKLFRLKLSKMNLKPEAIMK